jgi:hypothetical protein
MLKVLLSREKWSSSRKTIVKFNIVMTARWSQRLGVFMGIVIQKVLGTDPSPILTLRTQAEKWFESI